MTKNNVVIVGSNRLAEELANLLREKSVEAQKSRDLSSIAPAAQLVIDTESGPEARKRALLERLDGSLPASALIVSSCLRFGTTQIDRKSVV